MTALKIRMVKLKDIKKAKYNPPGRAVKAPQSALKTSIEENGLQYPLLITKDNELVDGHRRLACIEALGWEEVPCIETVTDQAKAYSAVNTTMQRMTGNDVLHVYFSGVGKDALTTIQKGKIDRAVELVGEELVKQLYENEYSLRLVDMAIRTAFYCSKDGKRFLQSSIRWMMKFGVHSLETAMDMKTDSSIICDAINDKKALKLSVSKSE